MKTIGPNKELPRNVVKFPTLLPATEVSAQSRSSIRPIIDMNTEFGRRYKNMLEEERVIVIKATGETVISSAIFLQWTSLEEAISIFNEMLIDDPEIHDVSVETIPGQRLDISCIKEMIGDDIDWEGNGFDPFVQVLAGQKMSCWRFKGFVEANIENPLSILAKGRFYHGGIFLSGLVVETKFRLATLSNILKK